MLAWNLATSSSPLNIKIVGTTTILYFAAASVSDPISTNDVEQSFNLVTQSTLLAALKLALNCTTHKSSDSHGFCAFPEIHNKTTNIMKHKRCNN